MQVFIFFYLHYFCLWVCGWVLSLGLRKMPHTHGMVNVSSVTTSPQLQGSTMVGKCVGWRRTGFVSSQCCFLFTDGPWLCCVFESISTASTGLCLDEWLGSVWMSGAGELSLGFAGPPPLPAISMDTTVLFKVSQLPLLGSTKMGRWKERCLFGGGTVLLPLTLQAVYEDCSLSSPPLPHSLEPKWMRTVSMITIPTFLPIPLPLLIPIYPPSNVLMHESFKHVCVLSRAFFVELWSDL